VIEDGSYLLEMKSSRLKVLVVAHEFSPDSGSECAVGWNLVTRLAGYHDVTVLYASGRRSDPGSYQKAVTEYFMNFPPIDGLVFINIDQPAFTRFTAYLNSYFSWIGPIGLPFLYYIGYNSWHREVYQRAKLLQKSKDFNVVHQLTQISFREPGYTWKLGIPFFWGPTGGQANLPWKFFRILPSVSKIMEGMRYISNIYQSRMVPRILSANRRASLIYTYSVEDAHFFAQRARGEIKYMLDVGTTVIPDDLQCSPESSEILTGVWCGQLTYRKAPDLLLKSLAKSQLTRERVKIKIIGSGPIEKAMHELADVLGLKNIEWIRQVPHSHVFDIMRQADFLVHTSLREATSSVIPEALSLGLPVICHDVNGMGLAVTEACGIKISLVSPENSINGFNEAITRLILDRNLVRTLKLGARKRSPEISWDNMARTIAVDYIKIVNSRENEQTVKIGNEDTANQ
jgi:glycosyltransferase involved in cell wall biosynthesis